MSSQPKSKLLQAMQSNLRFRHYSPRTEEAYLAWVKRFARFHGFRHPDQLGDPEVASFLGHLATERGASASTLNQALAALTFLYREIVRRPLGLGRPLARPRGPTRLPVVLTPAEVGRVLGELVGTYRLIGMVLYGSGLRLLECLTLRIKDVDLDRGEIRLRRGKGDKDRITVLANGLRRPMAAHLRTVRVGYEEDLATGGGWVVLPGALERKYPAAARSWPWQWVFPAISGFRDGAPPAPPSPRIRRPARRGPGRDQEPDRQAGHLSHIPALLRDPSARVRVGHPHGPGVVGPSGCFDDHALYSRSEPRVTGRPEPAGRRRSRRHGQLVGGLGRGWVTYWEFRTRWWSSDAGPILVRPLTETT
jgi:integrase